MSEDLTGIESHFAFGENWADFADRLDETAIAHAEAGLVRLIDGPEFEGRSFLDIGCGSGLHTLSALRLGAGRALAVDIDSQSVATAGRVLERFAQGGAWQVEKASVFELEPAAIGVFDIVCSWGVLHHTGDLEGALDRATRMARPGGLIALGLYRRTLLDRFWAVEKRWYTGASHSAQTIARALYMASLAAGLLATRQSLRRFRETYKSRRGMSLAHDVHDWLGGYPYEPISAGEVATMMERLGFDEVKHMTRGTSLGLLGSDCDEFVYRRRVTESYYPPFPR